MVCGLESGPWGLDFGVKDLGFGLGCIDGVGVRVYTMCLMLVFASKMAHSCPYRGVPIIRKPRYKKDRLDF